VLCVIALTATHIVALTITLVIALIITIAITLIVALAIALIIAVALVIARAQVLIARMGDDGDDALSLIASAAETVRGGSGSNMVAEERLPECIQLGSHKPPTHLQRVVWHV
jgi:hypothetical protein